MKNILTILLLFFTFLSCNAQIELKKLLETYDVKTKEEGESKGGYWYKGKCWAHFKEIDRSISKKDIDSVIATQMKLLKTTNIHLNDQEYPLNFFSPEEDQYGLQFITVFTENNSKKTLLQQASSDIVNQKQFQTEAVLINGNIMELPDSEVSAAFENPIACGIISVKINDMTKMDIHFAGTLVNEKSKKHYDIKYTTNEVLMGLGNSTLKIKGNETYLNGDLGTITYLQIKNLIANHPNVKTLVLENVPGSVNDFVNMHTGRLIKEAGLNTKVLYNSKIASGGVDLFCSGKKRIITKGAKIGVHSWGAIDFSAIDLPDDHPAHQYQIEYFKMCLGDKIGEAFYFYTIKIASADDIHWMKVSELKKWKVGTNFIEK
jgi:hypothetical protein